MKKKLLYMVCLCLLSNMLFGQESIEVTLGEDNLCSEKELTYLDATIKVCMVSSDKDEKAIVSILMENNYQSERLIVFGHQWNNRELKRMGYLNKTRTEILAFEACEDVVVVDPSDDGYIVSHLEVDDDDQMEYTIPVYIARGKKKGLFRKRRVISDAMKIELTVTVEGNANTGYARISREVGALYNRYQTAISNHEFCTNAQHYPKFKRQIEKYEQERDDLRLSILLEKRKPHSAKKIAKYDNLLEKLDAISFDNYKYDCGKHRGGGGR